MISAKLLEENLCFSRARASYTVSAFLLYELRAAQTASCWIGVERYHLELHWKTSKRCFAVFRVALNTGIGEEY